MRCLFLFFLLLAGTTITAQAQWYPSPPIWSRPPRPYSPRELNPSWLTVGGYFSLGTESHDTPAQTSAILFPAAGIFADFTRHPIRPGVDLRGEGGTLGVRGTLLGPRVSYNYRTLHPYAEFLLGPNHYETQPTQIVVAGSPAPNTDVHGLAVKGVIGIDVDFAQNASWRILEYSIGNFDGVAGSHPQSFSMGIVVRLP